ncbi:hypothetical protein [Methylococcus geothermalis]|uniref:Uncharacterized protein n=1 Tax=Methylococcus geothermalis TaxID=2681310 RepID=A0A858QBM2_9GAMM|nr:hypothetical protein [Methylococcus geothermalis]QJD31104.1 hypothetical protein GNH96_14915 [Methylococcus geothermalis]
MNKTVSTSETSNEFENQLFKLWNEYPHWKYIALLVYTAALVTFPIVLAVTIIALLFNGEIKDFVKKVYSINPAAVIGYFLLAFILISKSPAYEDENLKPIDPNATITSLTSPEAFKVMKYCEVIKNYEMTKECA